MKKDASNEGVDIILPYKTSGYRPCGEKGDYYERGCSDGFSQWCAWEKYKAGVGNLASNPTRSKGCSSNHGWGIAIDIKGSDAKSWVRNNGEKYGWWWGEAPSEDWHFTYDYKRDIFLEENRKANKKSKGNWLLYTFIGISVIGFGVAFYFLTSPKK